MTAALTLSLLAALASTTGDDLRGAPDDAPNGVQSIARVAAPAPAPPSTELNRLELKVQPFLGLTSNSWGSLGEARFEHDFRFPLTLGIELAPVALVQSGDGTGALAQARLTAALNLRYLAVASASAASSSASGATACRSRRRCASAGATASTCRSSTPTRSPPTSTPVSGRSAFRTSSERCGSR